MTDSESDDVSNVFTFQNDNTTVSAKGPNTNITNLSFRKQLTSTMYMPRNFERQRYAESYSDQRSIYYRRETSPMSIHSACDIRPRNFQQYHPGMSSQRSVFNGRSGSPMSIRSIDSTASVSAADIAFAFKNVKFNKYDLKVIKDAYHKLMKQRVRKRIEKRRNMRLFLKGSRRRSGDDSGEQGSNSSISSDDCTSIKTTFKENMFNNKLAKIQLTDFRKPVKDNNMLKHCLDDIGQRTSKNIVETSTKNSRTFNNTSISKQSNPLPAQKDRFRNGFLLPSQRFNRTVASLVIPENMGKANKNTGNNIKSDVRNHHAQIHSASGSEEEEIFSEMTVRENSIYNNQSQRKRSLDSEDESNLPNRKRSKISSPTKNAQKNKRDPSLKNNPLNNNNEFSNDFVFAKPMLPVRKSKSKVPEKLIAKSSQPLTDFLEPPVNSKIAENIETSQPHNKQEISNNNQSQVSDQSETTQNSDVSMRPSFIKRKLFTQKLDVAEKANLSGDVANSPHNNVYSLQKEKTKARKLVTNQSCLNRDVQDDNNLLDLIHKIVPPYRMNITNQTTINQTKIDANDKNKADNEDKWDVTSVISMCNDEDVSDTYTDEEIYEENNSNDNSRPAAPKTVVNNKKVHQVVPKQNIIQNINFTHNNISKNNVTSAVKSFWDTDLESDSEYQTTALQRINVINNVTKANAAMEIIKQDFKHPVGYAKNIVTKKSLHQPEPSKHLNNISMNTTAMNNTTDSRQIVKFNTSTLSIRSHRTSKKKNCSNETCKTKSKSENQKNSPAVKQKASSSEQNKKSTESKQNNTKIIDVQSKASQNEKVANKTRSTSNTRNKSPKEKKTKTDKQIKSPKDINKTKSKPVKSNEGSNNKITSKSEKRNTGSANKSKIEKQTDSTKENSYSNSLKKKKGTQNKSPKNKSKSNRDRKNSNVSSKKTTSTSQQSKLNNTAEPIESNTLRSDRPIRSCRTPAQNRSVEISRTSQLSNTSDSNRTLRSRTINLSSSIENIINIKPRSKAVNNKNSTQINARKSDISFSLAPDKQALTPKICLARCRADFFKGKRIL